MLQPGSSLSGGVTQCLLLNSASHAVASGMGSAAGTGPRNSASAAFERVFPALPSWRCLRVSSLVVASSAGKHSWLACVTAAEHACEASYQNKCEALRVQLRVSYM